MQESTHSHPELEFVYGELEACNSARSNACVCQSRSRLLTYLFFCYGITNTIKAASKHCSLAFLFALSVFAIKKITRNSDVKRRNYEEEDLHLSLRADD